MKNAEVTDLSKQWFQDQADWLDAEMKKILPERFHKLIEQGRVDDSKIKEFMESNGICIHFYENVPLIRISCHGRFVAELKQQFTVDGRPVDSFKVKDREHFGPHQIWADGN